MSEKKDKFDQKAMDRVTDQVLAFKPKKPKRQEKNGETNQQSGQSK